MTTSLPSDSSPFPPPGCAYFWFLNDGCDFDHLRRQIHEFAQAGVTAICPHARSGLLVPYAGADWFDLIRRIVQECAEVGLKVWLYDEDYCPSGVAGGWITAEYPEYVARAIECFQFDPAQMSTGLFCFPEGRLLWAGLVPDDEATEADAVDLKARVGMLRNRWEVYEEWDSRWYYPATPLYKCPRSWTCDTEFGLQVPDIPAGMRLVAFVARPVEPHGSWNALPDALNASATEMFLKRIYDGYRDAVGEYFGSVIPAVFTDEPKYAGRHPWTPGMCEDFQVRYGYDLGPRLYDLFTAADTPRTMLTRIHYRQLCGERFRSAWLQPVHDWCHSNGLKLVGHISPEDDPVEQANTISNLFPTYRYFEIPGLDLIIPAVGDKDHPLINIGVVATVSAAQQQNRPGVLSESLGASGLDFTADGAQRILYWQTVMGMTTPVIHAAFASTEGPRLYDAPPDFGPDSTRWDRMKQIHAEIVQYQRVILGARQEAPVAILWPIRTFLAMNREWQAGKGGLREDLALLLLRCLEQHIGVHLLDEADLWRAESEGNTLSLGLARYSHILVPPCIVLHDRTVNALQAIKDSGVDVRAVGNRPQWVQTQSTLVPADLSWCPCSAIDEAVAGLPRLVCIEGDCASMIRCSVWEKDEQRTMLLMNIGQSDCRVTIDGKPQKLPATRIVKQ